MVLRILLIFMHSLALEYRFLRNFGEVFYDYSGNGLHGVNGLSSSTTKANLQVTDRGVYLNGKAGCVQLPSNDIAKDPVTLGSSFLIQMWILSLNKTSGLIFFRSLPFFSELIISQSLENESLEVSIKDFQLSETQTVQGYFSIRKVYLAKWFHLSIKYFQGQITIFQDMKLLKSFGFEYREKEGSSSFIGHASKTTVKALISLFSLSDLENPKLLISNLESSNCFSLLQPCSSTCFPSILIENVSGCLSSDSLFQVNYENCGLSKPCLAGWNCDSCPSLSCYYDSNKNSSVCIDFSEKTKTVKDQQKIFTCDNSCLFCTQGFCKCPDHANYVRNSCRCKEGFFLSFNSNKSAECRPCLFECSTCTQANSCLACKTGFFLDSSTKNCRACHEHCKTCTQSFRCLDCKAKNAEPASQAGCQCKENFIQISSFFNSTEACIEQEDKRQTKNSKHRKTQCEDGKYSNPGQNSQCVPCPGKCKTCSDQQTCLSCADGKFLEGSNCKNCLAGCSACSDSSSCQTCTDPFELNAGVCKCKDRYYLSQASCLACSQKCKTCSDFEFCTSCENSIIPTNGICGCLAGFYLESGLECVQCEDGCEVCTKNGCTKCFESWNLNEGTCDCPTNSNEIDKTCTCSNEFYMEKTSDLSYVCKKCELPCLHCNNQTFCTKCFHQDQVLNKNNGTCQTTCQDGSFVNGTKCEKCQELCKVCHDPKTCEECIEYAVWSDKDQACRCLKSQLINKKCVKAKFKFQLSKDGKRIFLAFNESLEEKLERKNFSLSLVGKGEPEFEFSSKGTASYIFSLKFSSSVDENAELKIRVMVEPLESALGSVLLEYSHSIYLDKFIYNSTSGAIKAVVDNAKPIASSSVFTTIGISLMSNPSSAWVLVNTLQLISYLPISSNSMTTNIKDFCTSLAGFNLLPNPISYMFDEDASDPPNHNLQSAGIETSVFWINAGQNASILILMICFCPFVLLLSKIPWTNLSSKFQSLLKNYRYGVFLRYWIQAYLDLSIFALIQMTASINLPGQGYFNLGSATMIMLIIVLTPPFLFVCSYVSFTRIKDDADDEYKTKYGSLYYEFKNDGGLLSTQFYTLFFIRRLSYVLAHFYLDRWPFVKMGVHLGFTLLVLAFICYFRPQREKTVLISCFIGEIAVLNAMIINLLLAIPGVNENAQLLDGFFIFGTFLFMALQTLISLFEFFVAIFEIYKKLEKIRAITFAIKAHATLSIK